jgi:hypothetical protein
MVTSNSEEHTAAILRADVYREVRLFCYSRTLFSTYQSKRRHYPEDCSTSIKEVLTADVTLFFLLLTFSLKNPPLFCQLKYYVIPQNAAICARRRISPILLKLPKIAWSGVKFFVCLLNTLIYRGMSSPPSSSAVPSTLVWLFVIWKIC